MEEAPHSHDFDMYLYFLGVDDPFALDAEIEIGFGEEQVIYKVFKREQGRDAATRASIDRPMMKIEAVV
jgi:hypothetical protein